MEAVARGLERRGTLAAAAALAASCLSTSPAAAQVVCTAPVSRVVDLTQMQLRHQV
jgi:hypothetical protein